MGILQTSSITPLREIPHQSLLKLMFLLYIPPPPLFKNTYGVLISVQQRGPPRVKVTAISQKPLMVKTMKSPAGIVWHAIACCKVLVPDIPINNTEKDQIKVAEASETLNISVQHLQ